MHKIRYSLTHPGLELPIIHIAFLLVLQELVRAKLAQGSLTKEEQ